MPSLAAALLTGGKSRRMGRDKALLRLSGCVDALWQRQMRTLEALQPEEIFWSGPELEGLPKSVRLVTDEVPNAGPLGGISACLKLASSDLLLVLAIDLPLMDAEYLEGLAGRCTPARGAVPQRGKFFEPLAAVYPRLLCDLATDRLRQGRYALQEFVHEAVRRELVEAVPIGAENAAKFGNVNSPEDLDGLDLTDAQAR
jgi:molybdopterin-guanine dinucleotide biosynthesis protein A